jgi:hypothetical protein
MKTRFLCAAALALVAFATPATFQSADAREPLTDEQMDDARGGILVAGNLAFEFGAVMKTYEDGALALQTQVNWTPEGPQVSQIVGPDVTSINTPAGQALANSANVALNSALKNSQSAFITSSGAALVQNVDSNQVLNAVLNTASNHTFRTDTDVTLVLPGYATTQAGMSQGLAASRIADEMSQVLNFSH